MRIRYTGPLANRGESMRTKNFLPVRLSAALLTAILVTAIIPSLFAKKTAKSGRQIGQVLQDAVSQKGFPGVVAAVWRADKLVYQGAAGKQDSTKNIPMTLDSIFSIASMT